MSRVAIVGAGVAGLTLARELSKRHYYVDIFEKSRGRGGRLSSKRLAWGAFDLGAQYFTARTVEFKQQVERWLADGIIKEWQFSPAIINEQGKLVDSPDSQTRYIGFDAMNHPAHYLSKDLEINFSTRIQSIKTTPDGHQLTAEDEQTFGFYDWVVTAIPAEQTIQLLETSSTDYLKKIPTELHYPCWAVALSCEQPHQDMPEGIFGDSVVSWVSKQSAKRPLNNSNKSTWVIHFSPSWSKEHIELDKNSVKEAARDWLQHNVGVSTLSEPSYVHFWRYANLKPIEPTAALIDHEKKIASIGDWTQGGRVEGAFLSALALLKTNALTKESL